jgi:accessory gene regulator protein AgrB
VAVHQALAVQAENIRGVKAESSGMEAVGVNLCQLALVWSIGLQKMLAWQTIAGMLQATFQHQQDNFRQRFIELQSTL